MNFPNKVDLVPVSSIRVINPRARGRTKFKAIIESIAKLGTKQPITVCKRRDGGEGYDLVCGEGRLTANIQLGKEVVPAIIIDAPPEDCYLMSLVENLARRATTTVETARDIAALKKRGLDTAAISENVGLSEAYVNGLLRLLERGEERLVDAVERGELPMATAIQISSLDDKDMQRTLAKAYESGKLVGRALIRTRRIIEQRRSAGKELRSRGGARRSKSQTPDDLVRIYKRETTRREEVVRKVRWCEEQLRFVSTAFRELFKDRVFVDLVEAEKLADLPKNLAEVVRRR